MMSLTRLGQIATPLTLADALASAEREPPGRRCMVATIIATDTGWWGGNIDDWRPDESRLSSPAALDGYRDLLARFRVGDLPVAHVVMAYKDGTFESVMLGICSRQQADTYLREVMELVRKRSMQGWVRA